MLEAHEVTGAVREEFDRQVATHGRMTHMKRTLAHSEVALRALMEWYALEAEVKPFLGERLTRLFVHAISSETDCLICSTFFRRLMVEAGEDPDTIRLDAREQAVVDFGRQMAKDSNQVSDPLYAELARQFTPPEIVTLTAFGALMIATNVFNNVLRVELDPYLHPFARGAGAAPASAPALPSTPAPASAPATSPTPERP